MEEILRNKIMMSELEYFKVKGGESAREKVEIFVEIM